MLSTGKSVQPKGAPPVVSPGCLARCRIQNIGAAPGAVPDVRIHLRVARERIFLPLVPSHRSVDSRQRPDQGLIERRPDAAGELCSRVPHSTRHAVIRSGLSLSWMAPMGDGSPQLLVDALTRMRRLLLVGDSANDRPRLRFNPHSLFAQPSQRWPKPGAAEPFPRPLFSAPPSRCSSALARISAIAVVVITRVSQQLRVVVENISRHRGVQHALALLSASYDSPAAPRR